MPTLPKVTRSSTSNSTKTKRKPVRRALIIGIAYKGAGDMELRLPHNDAESWKKLLIGTSRGFIVVDACELTCPS